MAAVGEGNRDAVAGALGMLTGAFVFVRLFPAVENAQTAIADFGKLTLPAATSIPAVAWIALLGGVAIARYGYTKQRAHRLASAR